MVAVAVAGAAFETGVFVAVLVAVAVAGGALGSRVGVVEGPCADTSPNVKVIAMIPASKIENNANFVGLLVMICLLELNSG